MKIDNSVKSAAGLPPNDGRTRSAKESPKTESASGGGEKVELSSLSARLQQMEETIANTPVVDSAKVDEIKQAITEGRFTINTGAIADRLIGSARELLLKQKSS